MTMKNTIKPLFNTTFSVEDPNQPPLQRDKQFVDNLFPGNNFIRV